jgi:hypothetical protein
MNRRLSTSRRQLALFLEREAKHPLPEETHQALVTALADLLLEALGREHHESADEGGNCNEP